MFLRVFNLATLASLAWLAISWFQVVCFNTTTASYPAWNMFVVLFGGGI